MRSVTEISSSGCVDDEKVGVIADADGADVVIGPQQASGIVRGGLEGNGGRYASLDPERHLVLDRRAVDHEEVPASLPATSVTRAGRRASGCRQR